MNTYIEAPVDSEVYRAQYRDGIYALIGRRYEEARARRLNGWASFPEGREEYKREVTKLLGWPLTQKRGDAPKAMLAPLFEEGGVRVLRARIEALPGVYMTGALFLRDGGARPFVMALHGKEGTPELCASLLGDSSNYNDMARRLVARGANVFAPQLLLWNADRFGAPYDRARADEALKHTGGSIVALELYCLMRCLDCALNEGWADIDHIGACGLSYGGFYALGLMAMDERVRAAVSAARFTDIDFERSRVWSGGLADMSWFGSARVFLRWNWLCCAIPESSSCPWPGGMISWTSRWRSAAIAS